MIASLLGVLDPGDEVVVFEPFYENYGPDAILSGAAPRFVTLHAPDWRFDPDELRARLHAAHAGDHRQHAAQPDRQGLHARRAGDDRRALPASTTSLAITDEIYEHILYDGEHVPMATLPGMARAHGHDQRLSQDLQGHRLAGRLGDRAAAPHDRHPQGPRLPDRRRRGAAAGGGRGRARRCRTPTTTSSPTGYRERRDALAAGARARPASARTRRTAPTT